MFNFDVTTTPESIKGEILSKMPPGISTFDGSYTDTLVSGAALEIWKVLKALEAVPACVHLTPESPRQLILDSCGDYGILPKEGSRATALLTIHGQEGVSIAKGKQFLTPGGLEYVATSEGSIASGIATVTVEAKAVGTAYNQPAGRIIVQMQTQPGIVSVESGPATGGTEPESIESLLKRYYLNLQSPPTSANAYQYKLWAVSVDGVGDALIIPLQEGPGTVGVVLASPDLLPVDETVIQRCKAYLETVRPADAADVLVKSTAGVTVNVAATVRISTAFTLPEITAQFKAQLAAYCKGSIALKATALPYAKVGYTLLGIPGVEDYSNLTLNGITGNIALSGGQVPVIDKVVLTC